MNPFGIIDSLLGAIDRAIHYATTTKRKLETKWQ